MGLRLLPCFISCLLWLSLAGDSQGVTVSGRVFRRGESKPASSIERYPTRTGLAAPNSVENQTQAIVYLTGAVKGPFMAPGERPQMIQKDQDFQPALLPILVGTTVEFPNLDPVYHNVFSYSKAKKFDLGRYPKGKSKAVTFDTPGLVKVFCEIHPSMRAHILVLEQPYFCVTQYDGSYQIHNVPPGDYTLHVWQENLPEIEMSISVPAQDAIIVDVR